MRHKDAPLVSQQDHGKKRSSAGRGVEALRTQGPVHPRSKGTHDIRPASSLPATASVDADRLRPRGRNPSHSETSEKVNGVWFPKQPALFVMNEVIDCPVPVFGRLPKRFLETVVQPALGVARADILHICSGSLREGRTVDIRPEVRPWLVADALHLPLKDDSEEAVFLDPPYTPAWARQYGVKYPPTYPLLREAIRVLKPGARLALFHFLVPFTPKGARLVKVYGVTVGMGYQIRALTLFEKDRVLNGREA